MKKLLFIVSFLCVSLLSIAQAADSVMTVKHGGKHHSKKENHDQKVAQVANPAGYGCPTCFATAKVGGKCAADQADMVQLGTYYCERCVKASGDKSGKCASCSIQTTRMTRKLCATKTGKMPVKKAA